MANMLIYVIVAVVAIALLVMLRDRAAVGHKARTPYIRGESIIYDHELGLGYIKEQEALQGDFYDYLIESEAHGAIHKKYKESDLLEPNKHLNIIGRPFIITSATVAKLAGKIDITELTRSFQQIKEQLAEVQAENKYLKNNMRSLVDAEVDSVVKILEKSRPMIRRGG